MPEWLYEDGLGEARAALVDGDAIVEAFIEIDGAMRIGCVAEARLTAITVPGVRGIVTLANGAGEALVEPLPQQWTLGQAVRVEIVRLALPERAVVKRPKARPSDALPILGPSLRERLSGTVHELTPRDPDVFEAAGWSELLEMAASGRCDFSGGTLWIEPTAAMTLIDVDGHLPPPQLAVSAARAAGRAIRMLGIGGSIGIDFPTVAGKAERTDVAIAFDAALPLPFERTALNGFGFMQVVRPRQRPSLIDHIRGDPAGHAARALLRRAQRCGVIGATRLVATSAVVDVLAARPEWLDSLARQLGGPVALRSDAARPIFAGHVQAC